MQKWVLVLLILVLLILFLLFIISKIGRILFEIEAKKIAKKILNNADIKDIKTIKEEDITGLPCTVQNWLRNSKVIGKQQIISVRLKQKGRMRIKKVVLGCLHKPCSTLMYTVQSSFGLQRLKWHLLFNCRV